jgi:hypothetical protein
VLARTPTTPKSNRDKGDIYLQLLKFGTNELVSPRHQGSGSRLAPEVRFVASS